VTIWLDGRLNRGADLPPKRRTAAEFASAAVRLNLEARRSLVAHDAGHARGV